jgi:aspartyl-tRNA(Asn)/glutamyl-tRNA(Gln) amidotransferase subunit B
MQKGHMRFEPNVNLAIVENGREFRTPIVEIKNINSFRFARAAIEYESQRQLGEWQADHDYVIGKRPNENRGWNAERGITEFQRGKEAAHDYRYFPDPDLAPVELARAEVDAIRAKMPELPVARRRRLVEQHKLAIGDAEILIDDRATADFFDAVVALGGPASIAAKQIVNTWIKWAGDRGVSLADLGVSAERVAELAKMTGDGTVSSSAAAQVAEAMLSSGESPRAIAERLGLLQVRDTAATEKWVEEAFSQNAQAVQDAMTNPKKAKAAAGFLRGQVMKLSGGKADPKLVGELIEKRLS